MVSSIFFLLYLFITKINTFQIIHNNNIYKKNINFKMSYESFKNYDEVINFIPSFQATIIINNWIYNIEEKIKNSNNKNIVDDNNYSEIDFINRIPKKIINSIYDLKFYISVNKEEKNTILLAWVPKYIQEKSVVYLIAGKIANNTIFIERIAQNPYYDNILDIKSINLMNDLDNIIKDNSSINDINYETLNNYDNRYLLSWNFINS